MKSTATASVLATYNSDALLIARHRSARYRATFSSDAFLSTYLQLREDGDSHSTACETIRGELLMRSFIHR